MGPACRPQHPRNAADEQGVAGDFRGWTAWGSVICYSFFRSLLRLTLLLRPLSVLPITSAYVSVPKPRENEIQNRMKRQLTSLF